MALAIPRCTPWTRQPPHPTRIDWSNPLTRGLVAAWVTRGLRVRNVVNNGGNGAWATNIIEPGPPVMDAVAGIGQVVNLTHDFFVPDDPAFDPITTTDSVSLLTWIKRDSADYVRYFFTRGADGAGDGWSLALSTTQANQFEFGVVYTSPSVAQAVATSTSSKPTVGAWVGGRYIQGDSVSMFVNGVREATTAAGSQLRASTVGLSMGRTVGGVVDYWMSNPYGLMSAETFVWKRGLADQEFMSLYDNPWQLFAPM